MSKTEIIAELHAAVAEERRSLKRVLKALADFDALQLAADRGYASTMDYCLRKLGYSGNAAYKRINAARLSRKHPEILDKLEQGILTLSAVAAVYPYAQKDNGLILRSVEGKSVREVEAFVAALNPMAPPRDTVQVIALIPQDPAATPETAFRVHLTLSPDAHAKLRRATDLLRHKHPAGEAHAVVEAALDALLDRVDRDRKKEASKPRSVEPGNRYIPEWVKDEVWKRDGGRCVFTIGEERCGAIAFIQYDHVIPFAKGGRSDDPGNIRLYCGAHNRKAAADMGLGWSGRA